MKHKIMDSVENAHYLAPRDDSTKEQEGNTVIIYPRDFDIVWGGDTRYWIIEKDNKDKPAELRQVCWLEVTTCVENTPTKKYIDPAKKYEVGFKISFAPDAFGWGPNYPIYFMTKRGNSTNASWKKTIIDVNGNKEQTIKREVDSVDLSSSENDDMISFGLYEVWSGKWKGGLRIHHAYVKEI